MEMTVRQEERCLEIALIGELDHHAAREIGGRLDRAIEAALPLRLVLDWSGVTFMDSSGIGVIIGRTKKLKYFNDSSVSVCNMSDRVDKLLKCAGIYTIIHKL